MRPRRISNWLFFVLALLLHLVLLAAAYFWNARVPAKQSLPTLAVSVIIPAAPASSAPPVPAPAAMPEKEPKRQRTPAKPPAKPKPVPRQTTPAPSVIEQPPMQASANESKVSSPIPAPAPEASAAPVTQAPVKIGISVNASYIAGETEKWYPRLSKRYGEQGTVVVRVHVSGAGRAETVELRKRSDYPLLDEAAIGLAKSLKYNPAKADGNPVADWVDIPITFRLHTP